MPNILVHCLDNAPDNLLRQYHEKQTWIIQDRQSVETINVFEVSKHNRPAQREEEDLAYEEGEERRALWAQVLPMSLNLEQDQWDGSHRDLHHLGDPSFCYVHQQRGTENKEKDFNSIQ